MSANNYIDVASWNLNGTFNDTISETHGMRVKSGDAARITAAKWLGEPYGVFVKVEGISGGVNLDRIDLPEKEKKALTRRVRLSNSSNIVAPQA